MYENESTAVRLGIEFLQAMTEKDYLLEPTFDVLDLESKLNEIQADVNRLISNLPVEAIDDDEEREQEYTGDFEDSEELEDEVVECEKLIAQATELLKTVREHYLPSEEATALLGRAYPDRFPGAGRDCLHDIRRLKRNAYGKEHLYTGRRTLVSWR